MKVFVGTYTRRESHVDDTVAGIYLLELAEDGGLTLKGSYAGIVNPSFLVPSADGRSLYSVSEISDFQGERVGGVAAYSQTEDGSLVALNSRPSMGLAPCHVDYAASTRRLYVANYTSGTVAAYNTEADGSLGDLINAVEHRGSGPNPRRQEGPHAHSINITPDERFVLVADLGIDQVVVYAISGDSGALVEHSRAGVAPGAGPRHLVFHPSLPHVYVINELDSTVTTMFYDEDAGKLTTLEALSTLPQTFQGESTCADIHITPDGRFLYGSNRGHDSLAIFAIDQISGRLTALGHQSTLGKTPRNFTIDPAGKHLLVANQDTDNIVSFHIHPDGSLAATGAVIEIPAPVCLRIR